MPSPTSYEQGLAHKEELRQKNLRWAHTIRDHLECFTPEAGANAAAYLDSQ